jgi:hypothetical protein
MNNPTTLKGGEAKNFPNGPASSIHNRAPCSLTLQDKLLGSSLIGSISCTMAEFDLLVLNGLVVTDQETSELDIAVKDGKIAQVSPRGSFNGVKAAKTIDAQGGTITVSCVSGL